MNLSRTLPLAVLGLVALGACSSGDLEGEARIADTDPPATAAPVSELIDDDTNTDVGTGDASVDEQIMDAVWEGPSGRIAMCPVFNEAAASVPTLSDEEVFDMGLELADLSESMTPAQIDRMRSSFSPSADRFLTRRCPATPVRVAGHHRWVGRETGGQSHRGQVR